MTAALGFIGAVASLLGIASVAIALVRRVMRRDPNVVQPIYRWSPGFIDQAFAQLKDYTRLAQDLTGSQDRDPDRQLSLAVLESWGVALILSIASQIDRFSQNKSTLFVLLERDETKGMITVLPKYFDGVFPLEQLLNADDVSFGTDRRFSALRETPPHYRTWSQSENGGSGENDPFIARRVIANKRVEMVQIDPQDVEVDLGTTHVLGIPLWENANKFGAGTPLAITIDFSWPRPWRSPLARILHGNNRDVRRVVKSGRDLKGLAQDFLTVFYAPANGNTVVKESTS
jgi:hypothetical protein